MTTRLPALPLTLADVLKRTLARHRCVIAHMLEHPKQSCPVTLRMYMDEAAALVTAIERLT